ncbi:MAG: Transcriptional regulator, LysR family, partial [Rhizobacter sp.]|nr:Transcriptional regulator, LysR family [Rhizobacter sp.]
LRPEVAIEVALYWHQWELGSPSIAATGQPMSRLDQVGIALVEQARRVFGKS